MTHLIPFQILFPSMCSSCSYNPSRISISSPILGLSPNSISKSTLLSASVYTHHSILFSSSTMLATCISGIHPSKPRSPIELPGTSLCISLLSQINALLSILFPAFSSIFITNICSDLSNFYFIAQSMKQCIHTSSRLSLALCSRYLALDYAIFLYQNPHHPLLQYLSLEIQTIKRFFC